ncbi:hypothetical protein BUE80_DR011117 [Diplocarpon rosae]|nr:hypothetical protein BUE80_DR011117 [Diplocarpon rosae]
MKPTSSFSFFLFLQLASATSILEKLLPADCHRTSCRAFRSALLSSKPSTPPTRLTSPNFLSHQLSSPDTLGEEGFDNQPITPSTATPASIALSSEQPLSSAFLLSLANPASNPTIQKAPHHNKVEEALPSRPTSDLPTLRKEDARRYWASLRLASPGQDSQDSESTGPRYKIHLCGAGKLVSGNYVTLNGVRLVRDYSDLLVVGIVMLFLLSIVVLEIIERVGRLSATFSGRRQARGQIYLEDDDTVSFIVKGPDSLRADPSQYQTAAIHSHATKDEFQYDLDADMRV